MDGNRGKQGKTPEELIQLYKDGGYYMLRSKWASDAMMMVVKITIIPRIMCTASQITELSVYIVTDVISYRMQVSLLMEEIKKDNLRKSYRATTMHNTMTKNSATIADGYMNGKFLLQESKGNIDVLVTENKSYGDLTHRRAIFFCEQDILCFGGRGL